MSRIYNITQRFPERLDDQRLKRHLPADIYEDVRSSLEVPSRLDDPLLAEFLWQQMKVWVDYGMEPMHVLSTATRHGAEVLKMADELGTIEPGNLADIIVVDGNPLMDMMALRDPVYVIKEGQVLKEGARRGKAALVSAGAN